MLDPVRVVYIMGYGRSGSTVLDTVLGNVEGVESVGELANVARSGWRGGEPCACGRLAKDCPFWSSIRRRWEETGGDLDRYLALQARYESHRAWSRLTLRRRSRGEGFRTWARLTAGLFRAVAEESGARVVVDSSKSPVRALALHLAPEIDLFVIHLVRDGRGVAWSLSKAYARDPQAGVPHDFRPRSVVRTALSWSYVNLQASRVRRGLPPERGALLRYEDYLDDLGTALVPVSDFLGTDVRPVVSAVANGEPLEVGHTVAGNRLRMSEAIRLRPDVEWKERMPAAQSRRFWCIAGPVMRRLGYSR